MKQYLSLANLALLFFSCSLNAAATFKVGSIDLDMDNSEEEPWLDYLHEAAANLDITLQVIELPEARAHHLAIMGELDAEAFPYDIPSRESPQMIKVNVPIETAKLWVWVHINQQCISDPAQLKNLQPVGTHGIPYFDIFYQLSEVGYSKVPSTELMVEMLSRGRADYFAATHDAVHFLLSEEQRLLIKHCLDAPYIEIQSHLYLHKKHQAIVSLFEQELNRVISLHPEHDD
ncbi:hypothetical protein ACVFI8_16445 [Agarivorans sp. MS3-6]|uniref:hypothetical protein n=1 Tax=Agarivorans sp. TSD2052 TaxID=2937286 RepID=UPI00200BD94A|nr:hypothetical protein [Agarivorans sp. TSD2052]UPW17547.1 hypothetical protein M0C34_15055 [Agarivorans sp. TSD2052]